MSRSSPEQSERTLEAFELTASVWSLVEEVCPEKETSEVKRIVGHSLVEQAKDLREEAEGLLEIWRCLRESNDDGVAAAAGSATPRLPEPPALRERLVQEVRFFVKYLRGGSQEADRPIGTLSEGNRDVLQYVMKANGGGSSREGSAGGRGSRRGSHGRPPSTMSSRDGRETPLRSTPSSEEGSQTSILSDRLEPAQVNATEIDVVVQHLRVHLEEECDRRREDIRFLQNALEEESHYRSSIQEEARPEPTIQELRELGTKLEQEVLLTARSRLSSPPNASGRGQGRMIPQPPPSRPPPATANRSRVSRLRRAQMVSSPYPSDPTSPPHPTTGRTPLPPLLPKSHCQEHTREKTH